jgi:SPP1 gp7 family putative phage head morphogenesis protein
VDATGAACVTAKRITVSNRRPALMKLRARMTHVVHAFLMRQAPKIVGQILVLRGKTLQKSELSQDELDRIEEILARIDFAGWATLTGDVEDIIAEAVKDSGYAALELASLDVTADADVFNIVNELAVAYARERGAEMVGMKWQDGELIPNPNAIWQITESTRDMLRTDIADSIAEGWTNAELASKLSDSYAFSADRAMVIARTETIRASNQGTLAGFKASGVVLKKEWTTAEDDRVSEDCELNGDQGPIDVDADFQSGDDAPPAHPNCRCVLVGLTSLDIEEPATEEQAA